MAYKDKDKQREAQRERTRRYRSRRDTIGGHSPKGVTQPEALQVKGVTNKGVTQGVTKRGKDIQCFTDLPPDVQQNIISMSTTDGKLDETKKAKRTTNAITYQHLFPDRYEPRAGVDAYPIVTGLPGDADYDGVCLDAKYDSRRIPLISSQDSSGCV